MANSKMIDDLKDLIKRDDINTNVLRRLIASAVAELYEKVDDLQIAYLSECKDRTDHLKNICTDLQTMENNVATLQTDTEKIKEQLDTNPAIQWGLIIEKHPTATKFVFILILLFIASNSIQTILDLLRGLFGI